MPNQCTVCAHEDAVTINEALVVQGASNRAITRQYELSKDAVRRHRQHIPELLVKASQAQEIADADSLLDQVKELQQRAMQLLDKAEAAEEYSAAVSAVGQARGVLELLAKLQGQLALQGEVNIYYNPQWVQLEATIVNALQPYPEAREAVALALEAEQKSDQRALPNGRA